MVFPIIPCCWSKSKTEPPLAGNQRNQFPLAHALRYGAV
jgi:hypothetical protein